MQVGCKVNEPFREGLGFRDVKLWKTDMPIGVSTKRTWIGLLDPRELVAIVMKRNELLDSDIRWISTRFNFCN